MRNIYRERVTNVNKEDAVDQQQAGGRTSVFEFPLNEFCNRYVNCKGSSVCVTKTTTQHPTFEFLYGICLPPSPAPGPTPAAPFSPSAAITSPSALKLLLIA